MYNYRYYQEQCLGDIKKVLNGPKNKKTIAVLPCAAGKSLIVAGTAKMVDTPVLVIQPTKELLQQNYEKFVSFGGEASIFSSSLKEKEIGHITYATPMSIKKTGPDFKKIGVKLIIIDECDYMTKTDGVINKIIRDINPDYVVGLTATPINTHSTLEEGSMLKMINTYNKNLFRDVCHVTQVKELVSNGFWSDVLIESIDINDNKLQINSSGTEYKEESIIDFYNDNKLGEKIVDAYKTAIFSGRKHVLIFVPTVQQAENISRLDNSIKIVSYETKDKERNEIVSSFKCGKTKCVICVDTLGVGFDFPELDCIIMARPTASYRVYYQQYGRGVRTHENKKNCLIIDFSTNTKRFGRPEQMFFENHETHGWSMFIDDKLMTNVPLKSKISVYRDGAPIKTKKTGLIKFWFGKYKGKDLKDVPDSYIKWVLFDSNFKWNTKSKNIVSFKNLLLKTWEERNKMPI